MSRYGQMWGAIDRRQGPERATDGNPDTKWGCRGNVQMQFDLGEEKTKKVLNNFYPYILFKTMLGNKLTPPQNIDISIAVPTINYPDFIKVKINLKTS